MPDATTTHDIGTECILNIIIVMDLSGITGVSIVIGEGRTQETGFLDAGAELVLAATQDCYAD
jgi:hypothetical protein